MSIDQRGSMKSTRRAYSPALSYEDRVGAPVYSTLRRDRRARPNRRLGHSSSEQDRWKTDVLVVVLTALAMGLLLSIAYCSSGSDEPTGLDEATKNARDASPIENLGDLPESVEGSG